MIRNKSYIIIGNGTAGLSAAEEIRKNDKSGKIIIITDENYLTYYRIKLSEGISKNFSDKEMFIHDKDWYSENNIQVMLESRVKNIDTKTKEIYIENKEKLKYDKLLIATGSSSFIPPIKGSEKEGVFALRSLDDLNKIKNYFENCKKITVLGGGLLGLEAAWAIRKADKEVDVVEFFPQLLPRQLDDKISKKFSNILKEKDLKLHLGVSAEEILGEIKATGISLSDGTKLETDAILISAGIRPRLDIIKHTEIDCDKGIKVDKYMQTNIEDVYAAGDVVEVDGTVVGLWGISNEQGKVAGANMAGQRKEYTLPKLTTMLRVADCSIFSAGDIVKYDAMYEEESGDEKSSYKLCITDGKVTGGIILNDISKAPKVKKAIDEKKDIKEYLEKEMSVIEIINSI